MDAAETLRGIAEQVSTRIADTGRTPAEVAKLLGIHPLDLEFPGVLTVGQIVALCIILDAHPHDFFPAGVTLTGGAR